MKILVTGGAGFLGSHVVDALVARGDEVLVVDHHERDKLRFPNPAARVIASRFGDEALREVLLAEKPDALIHVAAQISVTKSIRDPLYDAKTNIVDSVKLLSWAEEAGVKRFIFASSGGAIYGDHPLRPTPIIENPEPLSPYGIGKLGFEKYLESVAAKGKMSTISLRFSNFYGPRQQISRETGEGNVMTIFLNRLLVTGEPITIFGSGEASRDYMYVSDAVDAIVRALDSAVTGPINIGTGESVSVSELVDLCMEIHGEGHDLIYEPYRSGEVLHSVIDASSGRTALGWEPKIHIREGLRRTYEWYKDAFGQ